MITLVLVYPTWGGLVVVQNHLGCDGFLGVDGEHVEDFGQLINYCSVGISVANGEGVLDEADYLVPLTFGKYHCCVYSLLIVVERFDGLFAKDFECFDDEGVYIACIVDKVHSVLRGGFFNL